LLQPTLMPVSAEEAFVHFRNKGTRDQVTYYQSTRDGGASWSDVRASNFPAPNSSLVTARLDADLYVVVCNFEDRSKIVLKYSRDGVIWETVKLLDGSANLTFAYPAICVSGGTADLVYAWNDRAALKHVRFNREWLTVQLKG
jgi:predicted neuraminidase